jgi:hypothetical protein
LRSDTERARPGPVSATPKGFVKIWRRRKVDATNIVHIEIGDDAHLSLEGALYACSAMAVDKIIVTDLRSEDCKIFLRDAPPLCRKGFIVGTWSLLLDDASEFAAADIVLQIKADEGDYSIYNVWTNQLRE